MTLWSAAGTLVLLAAAAPLAAQEPEGAFQDALEVRVVNVDVHVIGRDGRPVDGLRREDFRLFEDGRPVEIVHFSRLTGRSPADADGGIERRELATGEPHPPEPLEIPSTVVLYIDNTTLLQPHRNRVLDELEEFVGSPAAAGLRFMVVTFDPGLEVRVPAGGEAGDVATALDRIGRMPASGLRARSDRRQAMTSIQAIYELYAEAPGGEPCTDGWQEMIAAADVYAQSADQRLGRAQAGLLGLTRSLGGIEGRKAVLYLSDGLEQMPGVDLYAYLGELCPERAQEVYSYMTRWDETRLIQELTAYANAHRVTFYALETAGLRGHSLASVEFDDRRFTPSPRNDTLRISNLQSSLFIMADETGGLAFFNANSPTPELERLARDLRDYYSLGFSPGRGWDGDSHTIRVELVGKAAKGATLRYRQRYEAVPEEERMAERTLAALVLGREENPLGIRVTFGEQRPGEGELRELPVQIAIPAASLSSIPDEGGAKRLLRVLMIAEDEKERRTPMREKLIPLYGAAGGAAAGPAEAYAIVVEVELRPGPHTLAIGVRDQIGRVSSYLRLAVDVAAADAVDDAVR